MRSSSPIEPSDSTDRDPMLLTKRRWTLAGFGLCALPPVAYGMYAMQQHYAYVSALAPNEGACGMGALSGLAMIFGGGPICGTIGALLGRILVFVRDRHL